MPASNTYKVLWNDAYLKSFAAELNQPACSHVFWEIDVNDELVDFKKHNTRKMTRMIALFLQYVNFFNAYLCD